MKLKNILPPKIYRIIVFLYDRFFNSFINKAYSQEGEDLILKRIFEEKVHGFYVDVGAHHPKRFSNTYLFYKKGWRGINIEAKPGSKYIFDKLRPRDINIEAAINDRAENLTYLMFSESALNTFSKERENFIIEKNNSKLIRKIEIKTKTLKEILDKYLPRGIQIDFLSIDTEGLDYNVLVSNDWEKYIPRYILIEEKDFSFEHMEKSDIYRYLYKKSFRIIGKTYKTLIFQHIN